jgi:hypothetical protein
MSFIRKLEEGAAKKLRRIFLDSNKRAEYAANDVERLEKELANAKIKAYNEAKAAYESAVQAADKAQKVATEMMLEVRACEERLKTQEQILKGNQL